MPTISPLISAYSAPFVGMDARTTKPEGVPSLLLNVDLSDKGSLKGRPGSKILANTSNYLTGGSGSGAQNPMQPKGMYAYHFDGNLFIFVITYDTINNKLVLLVYGGNGKLRSLYGLNSTIGLVDLDFDFEPDSKLMGNYHYTFAPAGRFVYFSNGHTNLYRLEINPQVSTDATFVVPNHENFTILSNNFETGGGPETFSYILTGLAPSSLVYFREQLVASGFKIRKDCKISVPLKSKEESTSTSPPEQLISIQRDSVTIDQASICVSEPGLWDSYPINDLGGFYWMINEDVVATIGLGTDLLVFTDENLYKIIGPGGVLPSRVKIAQVSLASSRSYTRFRTYIFFIATDGCYIIDSSGGLKKVSYEMEDLWESRNRPQITRSSNHKIKDTAFPYFVDKAQLHKSHCVNDIARQQIMVSLPSMGSVSNDMVWVFNYGDMLDGSGTGKWSIWTSGDKSKYATTSLSPGTAFPGSAAARPNIDMSNISHNVYNWGASADVMVNGEQRIFFITSPSIPLAGTTLSEETRSILYEFGKERQDMSQVTTYSRAGVPSGSDVLIHYPFLISLGRVGRVDHDGRVLCSDVAVRRKQFSRNVEEDSGVTQLTASVRSEGEGLKYFDATEEDVEFNDTILNSQQGVSENTTSVLNTMVLGSKPSGTSSPLMSSEYFDSYARVNTPDEEGRSIYVDLYAKSIDQPLRIDISEVRVYGSVKGGSQREQS